MGIATIVRKVGKRPKGTREGWHQVNVYLAQTVLFVTLVVAALLYLTFAYLEARWPIYILLSSYTTFLMAAASLSVGFILARQLLLFSLGIAQKVVAPFVWLLDVIPGLSTIVEVVVMLYFFACFRALLLFDRVIRWGLRVFCQVKHPSGRTLSIVNSCDPDFFPLGQFDEEEGVEIDEAVSASAYATHYSEPAAISLSNLARLVYEDRRLIAFELEENGFDPESLKLISYRNTCGFVARKDRTIVVSFRGTDPLNLMALYTDSKMGMVSLSALDFYDESGNRRPKDPFSDGEDVVDVEQATDPMAMGKIHYGFAQAMRLGQKSRADARKHQAKDRKWQKLGQKEVKEERKDEGSDEEEEEALPEMAKAKPNAEQDDFTTITLSNTTFTKSLKTAILGFFMIVRFAWTSLLLHSQDPIDSSFTGRSERKISAYEQAIKAVDALYAPGMKVYITGHSLGGALSIIFFAQAIHEEKHWLKNAHLYTYGAPRVGDKKFATFLEPFDTRIFHVINNNDIVPRVPWKKQEVGRFIPAMLLKGSGTSGKYEVYYDNAGTIIFIDGASGKISIDPPKVRGISFTKLSGILNSQILLRMRKENIVRIAFRLLTPFFLSDHIPCDYKVMLNVHRKLAGRPPIRRLS